MRTKNNQKKESVIAIIGGGRWGRVILSVLANMNLTTNRIAIITKHNVKKVQHYIYNELPRTIPCSIIQTLDELLVSYQVQAAIVANAAHQHFTTSTYLIERGINILIEKPMVLSSQEALFLFDKSKIHEVAVIPGLQYRFCSYIDYFRKYLNNYGKKPRNFLIEWFDGATETRYGEKKTYDSSINIAQDVMPHIWSILSTVFQQQPIQVKSCEHALGNNYAHFCVSINTIQGSVILKRDAQMRRRVFKVEFDMAPPVVLDFTQEPGTLYHGNTLISGDPNWSTTPHPLERQINYFLSVNNEYTTKFDVQSGMNSVIFSEKASLLLQECIFINP